MSNLLLRGLTMKLRITLQRIAARRNLSLNQTAMIMMASGIEHENITIKRQREREQAFRRIKELRQKIFKKHGYKQDSLKLLHEARMERERRLDGFSDHH